MSIVVGLTGGLGCGKSTVLEMFGDLGWHIVSADAICRELYETQDPELVGAIRERWGEGVIAGDGSIDRPAIAAIVFEDSAELAFLNDLLHPMVRGRFIDFLKQHPDDDVIFEVPLLFEAEWSSMFDAVIAVWSPESTVVENLKKRGVLHTDYERRIRNQMAPSLKLERADFGLINSGNIEILKSQVEIISNKLMKGNLHV